MSTWSTSAAPVSPAPITTCSTSAGRTRCIACDGAPDAERRQLRRLDDHRVAGEQRGNRVAERQVERRVPRADDADDAARPIRHVARACRTAAARSPARWRASAARGAPAGRGRGRRPSARRRRRSAPCPSRARAGRGSRRGRAPARAGRAAARGRAPRPAGRAHARLRGARARPPAPPRRRRRPAARRRRRRARDRAPRGGVGRSSILRQALRPSERHPVEHVVDGPPAGGDVEPDRQRDARQAPVRREVAPSRRELDQAGSRAARRRWPG